MAIKQYIGSGQKARPQVIMQQGQLVAGEGQMAGCDQTHCRLAAETDVSLQGKSTDRKFFLNTV